MHFFLGTQDRVRNSRGKRAISVRAIEVLLYKQKYSKIFYFRASGLKYLKFSMLHGLVVHYKICFNAGLKWPYAMGPGFET